MSGPGVLYSWAVAPAGPARQGGVSGDRERAMDLAAAALPAGPGAALALVEAVRPVMTLLAPCAVHERTGRSWTGIRGRDGKVRWAQRQARAAP